MTERTTELRNPFELIARLAQQRGISNLKDRPGCWEVELPGGWSFALNGHLVATTCGKGAKVPPINAYVEWQGTPMGFIDPYGGPFVGGDDGAEEFCDALAAEIEAKP
jgi:hypothetical protein